MFDKFDVSGSTCVLSITVLVLISLLRVPVISSNQHPVSGQCRLAMPISEANTDMYSNLGDINIGGFMVDPFPPGSDHTSRALQMTEAIAFAVNLVNEDPYLLPNVSLGFVLLNEGYNSSVAVAKSFKFLPRVTYNTETEGSCYCRPHSMSGINGSRITAHHNLRYYDVIGVISPVSQILQVLVSYALSAAQIPVISCVAIRAEIIDALSHTYFLNVIKPHEFTAEGIVEFIHSNNWSYISVLFMRGPAGETVYSDISKLAIKHNICIATSQKISHIGNFDKAVQDLLRFNTSSVVVLLLHGRHLAAFFQELIRHNASGSFIWIYYDVSGLPARTGFGGYEKDILGTFVISNQDVGIPELHHHISRLRINSTNNPWFKSTLEYLKGCSFSAGTWDNDSSVLDVSGFAFLDLSSFYVDAVLVFAHAMTKLLADFCPGVKDQKQEAV